MKSKFRGLILMIGVPIALISLSINFSGCSDDKKPSRQKEVTAALTSGVWKVSTVTVDGVDKTSTYKDLTLTFTGNSFSSTNGGLIWPTSGTYTFTDANASALKRNDNLEVQIQEATTSSLKLGLNWAKTTFGPGRIESLGGAHVFTFSK
ncbi:MAG: hypothetical protein ACKO1F_11765 [Flammeovirgaceae bacterium]